MKVRFGLSMPQNPDFFLTKSMTLEFAKKLLTRGNHYKAIPDPESTLPEGLLPDLPDELTHH